MECADVDDLLAGVALGSASPEETSQVEAHLATCREHAHLADFQRVADMLPMSLPPEPPPGNVKRQLMTRVYHDLGPLRPRLAWWQPTWSRALAAALAVVAVGLGVRDWATSSQLAAAPVSWQVRPVAAGNQASGTLVYVPGQNVATLALQGLQPLPADRVYEVWLIRSGKPEPAGVFRPGADGSAAAVVKGLPQSFETIAVTDEPGPQGSQAPTTQPFLTGSIQPAR